ncbi:complexed with cef1p [Coemansia sp. BCRC 34301]|nr:complexed with cef1p [Coemansia sp. BCRC 34301]
MTTAARPTFDPAKGKAPNELTFMTSAKDLPSHTKLKTRKPGQGTQDEYTIEDLKRELAEAEQAHSRAKRQISDAEGSGALSEESRVQLESAKARYIEMAQRLDAASDDDSEGDDDGSGGGESDESDLSDSKEEEEDSDDDSDSEDETAMLMRELEKIKRERAEEKAREEKDALERRLVNGDGEKSSFLGENPLLANRDFSVKRRWDDDVVFKNQAQGDDGKPKKRFVNDMLRSDFHRKFMNKYIQ